MAKEKKKIGLTAVILLFVLYFFAAARPVPLETVLSSRWLSSLESGDAAANTDFQDLVPFTLGRRFGYVDSQGRFAINHIKEGNISFSENLWAEYEAEPERIEIRNNGNETAALIENPRGYPAFLDGRIFLINSEQNALSETDGAGTVLWSYEFASPLTCIDAAAGLLLTGSLDGVVTVLDDKGERVFVFEPGGSRYAVILGCAISRDGSRFGIISGIDDQRFLLFERFGNTGGEYKVIYHEFLEDGFRRPVHIAFIEQDQWLVFEREGGVGVYDTLFRQAKKVPLSGEITAIDHSGGQGLFFVIISRSAEQKTLVGIQLPDRVIMEAPFKSGGVFLGRTGSRLLLGGGTTIASFELEKK